MIPSRAGSRRNVPSVPRRRAATVLCAALASGAAVAVAAAGPAAALNSPVQSSVSSSVNRAAPAPEVTRAVRSVVAAGAVGYLARLDDGRRVTVTAAGLADRATRRPLRADDQFEIGSNTKTFTAVLVMQLVAQGRLGLEDPVEKHLPGLVPNGDEITVRMLLQHTSGLFNYTNDPAVIKALLGPRPPRYTARQGIALAVKHDPVFAPGKGWSYSNTNYLLAGLIAEKVSGQTLADLVQQRIARPLGLKRTYLVVDRVTTTGRGYAHGYLVDFSTARKPVYTEPGIRPLGESNAAGGVVSTASELSTVYRALFQGKLVPAAQLAEMRKLTPLPAKYAPAGSGYGLGIMTIVTPCGTVWGHGGDTLGHHSSVAVTGDGRKVAVTDVTTQPNPLAAANPRTEKMVSASLSTEMTVACALLGKRAPAPAKK